jgi:hypothetical protein
VLKVSQSGGFPALLTITETDTYGNSASIQTSAQLSCIS